MAHQKNSGRQQPIEAYVDILASDLTSGVDVPVLDLPAGAVITDGDIVVKTVFGSDTADVLDVGDSGSQNRYKNDANVHALGIVALVPTGYVHAVATALTVRWVGTSTPAAGSGKVRLRVRYYVENRSQFNQG
jgi:hypothetical protein